MEEKDVLFQNMMRAIARYAPYADENQIRKAYLFADKRHENQKRKSGEPYVIHPVAVAEIVAEMGLDTDAITAALLHDCLEDTATSFDEVTKEFGLTVAHLVEGVTKLTRVEYSTLEEQQMENLRKMFLAMSRDIRVILIKIADRLHNMRTMQYQSAPKQISKSMETMEIYAPLAHRLGMQKIKWELEDCSLQYLEPQAYQDIMTHLAEHEEESLDFMNEIQSALRERMQAVGIKSTIYGRIKHTYSIYRKMKAQQKTIDELYDLYAFRVLVDTIPDCYNVLGHIHDLYNLLPGRFKDYISTPKPNMYQSLHTTVIGRRGIPFEVQIRTWDMHQTAEYGVAAHWKYKDGINKDGNEKEFEWVRRLLENQQDTEAEDYIHSLKVDMFDDEVFVFTPRGKVISLPSGSTPIDFAYAIHSAIGNTMVGAKVNNRIAGYDYPLSNGDIVEILTSKSAKGPSRDWLNICKSNQARNKIKQWFKKEKREENVARGRLSVEAELRRLNVALDALQSDEMKAVVTKKLAFDDVEDLYAAVGYGGLTAFKAVNRIKEELLRHSRSLPEPEENTLPFRLPAEDEAKTSKVFTNSGVIVEDISSCMVKFARCCTPVPGDDIVGFITKGYGVSVHRRDCANAAGIDDPEQAGRWVPVSWAATGSDTFSTSLEVLSKDRDGLLLDMATIMTSLKLKVTELSSRALPDGSAITSLTFMVSNVGDLEAVRSRIRAVPGVTEIKRGKV